MFTRNGFEQTDDAQVDIVKNLLGFTMPPWVTRAAESLHQQGITFDFCEPAFRQKYLQFMTEHLPGFSGWCEAAKDYVENEGDPRLRILAFHASTVVGFTAYSKDYDWYIWATGVRRDFRRKKIGSVLVFLALEEMKRRGASRMCISDCPYDFYKVVEGEVVRRYIWMAKALK
jgi:GNAT superfamily N-acetyltransferase